jgi:cytoskeleton protein RodZ
LARQLRLALRQVQALEENRFDDLPGNTFVRGFVRNYARVVQTDPAVFLEAYEHCRPQVEQPQVERRSEQIAFPRKSAPKWVWYLAILLLLLLVSPLVIYLALHDDESVPKSFKPASSKASSVAKSAVVVPMTLPPPQAVLQHIAPSPASGTQETAAITPEKPLPSASPTSATNGAANVQLNFDGDAWVEVRDKSGKIVFSKLNRRGDVQALQGIPPLSVVVGNAEQVRIAYNGKPFVLTPFIQDNVARFTLE